MAFGRQKRLTILKPMERNNCDKCLKNSFELLFGHTDRKHITITDRSEWMNNEKPLTYVINITNLTHNISNDVEILATGTNVLSSIEIFRTSEKVCLQDGFYCIRCLSCGKNYTINRVYLANTECMIDHLYVKADTKEKIDKINEFYQDLKMVKINAEIGRMETAQKIFVSLNKKLKALGCHDCGC